MSEYIITGPENQSLDTKFPTIENTILAIISQFTEEQLKQLEITSIEGQLITFEKQLWYKYSFFHPSGDIETIKILAATVLGEIERDSNKKITASCFSNCFTEISQKDLKEQEEHEFQLKELQRQEELKLQANKKWNNSIIISLVSLFLSLLLGLISNLTWGDNNWRIILSLLFGFSAVIFFIVFVIVFLSLFGIKIPFFKIKKEKEKQ